MMDPIPDHTMHPIPDHHMTDLILDNMMTPTPDHMIDPILDHTMDLILDHMMDPIPDHMMDPILDHMMYPISDHTMDLILDNMMTPIPDSKIGPISDHMAHISNHTRVLIPDQNTEVVILGEITEPANSLLGGDKQVALISRVAVEVIIGEETEDDMTMCKMKIIRMSAAFNQQKITTVTGIEIQNQSL